MTPPEKINTRTPDSDSLVEFGLTLGYHGQTALNGLSQAFNHTVAADLTGQLPELQVVAPTGKVDRWTSSWLAERAADGVAGMVTFWGCQKAGRAMFGSMAEAELLPMAVRTSKTGMALAESSIAGFGMDFALKPLDKDLANKDDFWTRRAFNGLSGAVSFSGAMGTGMLLSGGMRRLAGTALSNSLGLSTLLKNDAFVRTTTGALSGTLAGPAGTEVNTLLLRGRHATADELKESAASMFVTGLGLGAVHQLTPHEISADHYVYKGTKIATTKFTGERFEVSTTTVGDERQPLRAGDMIAKAAPYFDKFGIKYYRAGDVERAGDFTAQLHEANKTLEVLNEALKQKTLTDPLTGLWNRRFLDLSLETEMRNSMRTKAPMSVLFLDFDNFGKVNKLIGDEAGDGVLVDMSKIIKESVSRPRDLICRKGGDELVIILPETDAAGAAAVAKRIQEKAQILVENPSKTVSLQVSTSVGKITFEPGKSPYDTTAELLAQADEMMRTDKMARKRATQAEASELVGVNIPIVPSPFPIGHKVVVDGLVRNGDIVQIAGPLPNVVQDVHAQVAIDLSRLAGKVITPMDFTPGAAKNGTHSDVKPETVMDDATAPDPKPLPIPRDSAQPTDLRIVN